MATFHRSLTILGLICFLQVTALAGPPNPANPIMGIDLSTESQGYFDKSGWKNIYVAGNRFAFIRSSAGYEDIGKYHDPQLADQLSNGRTAGLLMGVYHVAYPAWGTAQDTAKSEADLFFQVAGSFMAPSTSKEAGYLRPVLDIESDQKSNGVTDLNNKDDYTQWVVDFSNELDSKIYARYGVHMQPIIYTYSNFASRHFPPASSALADITNYTLWISAPGPSAQYDVNGRPDIKNFKSWKIWQFYFNDNAPPPKPLLLDAFDGNLNDLNFLTVGAATQGSIVATSPNAVTVPGAFCTLDGVSLGKTDSFGRVAVPWYISGWHTVELQIGRLYRSILVHFRDEPNTQGVPSVSKAQIASSPSSQTNYPIELRSDGSCIGLAAISNFVVGDRVEVYGTGNGLRARYPDPCSDSYAVMPDLSVGTIVGTGQCCDGYFRWKIRFDGLQGIDVWSAEGEPATGQLFLRRKQNSTCSYSLAPSQLDLNTSGAAASGLNVNAGSSCYWNAVPDQNWISITTNGSGAGSKQVTFSVAANTGSALRTGHINIADQTFTVTQVGTASVQNDGGILALGLNETFVAKDATNGSMAVYNKGSGTLYWSASTATAWLTVTTPTGTATINGVTLGFACQPNTGGSQRVGTIIVSSPGSTGSPQTLTVTQGGSDTANVTISNLSLPTTASSGSNISVTWSQNSPFAQSNVLFLLTLYPNGQAPTPYVLTKYLPVTIPAGGSSFNTNYDLPTDLYSGPYDVEVSLWSDKNNDVVVNSGDILLGSLRKSAAMNINGIPPKPAPVTISDLSIPQAAAAGNNVSVTWSDNSPYDQQNVLFRLRLCPAGQTTVRFDLTYPYLAITIPRGGSSLNFSFQLPSNLYSGNYDAEVSLWSDLDHDGMISSSDALLGTFKKSSAMIIDGVPPPPPILHMSSINVDVASQAGGTSLSVTNLGLNQLNWSASTAATWLSLDLSSGSAGPSTISTLSFLFQQNDSSVARSATINITAPGASASPQSITVRQQGRLQVSSVQRSSGGSFALSWNGNAGHNYSILRSKDISFQTYDVIATNLPGSNPTFTDDTVSQTESVMFYRVQLDP